MYNEFIYHIQGFMNNTVQVLLLCGEQNYCEMFKVTSLSMMKLH